MARNYSKSAGRKVAEAVKQQKAGKLESGQSGKKVKSRQQAIAIGLSEARRAGKKVPKKPATKRRAAKKAARSNTWAGSAEHAARCEPTRPRTTDGGVPVASDEQSLTIGAKGPIVLSDHYLS